MGTAAAGPGTRLVLPWHTGTTDIHLDTLVCWAFKARSRADQRPVVRHKGQDDCVDLTGGIPGGNARHNQDPHWLPKTIPVGRWLELVKHPAWDVPAQLLSVLVECCQVEVTVVPVYFLRPEGRHIACTEVSLRAR